MKTTSVSRRKFIKRAALGTAAAIAAPYMRTSYSAGKMALAFWDHWVPGANDTLTAVVNEWGAKNHVEITIDYLSVQGNKDMLTASAEAQAKTGHDIMQHRSWQIQVHRDVLEPMDDIINTLVKEYGPISKNCEYLDTHEGHWMAVPSITGSQVKPCCSRIDL